MRISRLIYVSKARPATGHAEVDDILNTSRLRNGRLGVTGLLIFNGRYFMQMLEGSAAHVGEIFDSIRADERHEDVLLLMTDEADRREFPDWSMGYNFVEFETPPTGAGWFQLETSTLSKALPDTVSGHVRRLFTSFYALGRGLSAPVADRLPSQ